MISPACRRCVLINKLYPHSLAYHTTWVGKIFYLCKNYFQRIHAVNLKKINDKYDIIDKFDYAGLTIITYHVFPVMAIGIRWSNFDSLPLFNL